MGSLSHFLQVKEVRKNRQKLLLKIQTFVKPIISISFIF